jgi:hypothetical protein
MAQIANSTDIFQWNPLDGIPKVTLIPKPRKRRGPKQARDSKRDVQMAYKCGIKTPQIAYMLNLTARQVRYALDTLATPKKCTGPPSVLGPDKWQMLVDFVVSSKKVQRMDYKDLANEFEYMGWAWKAIKNALDCKRYNRCCSIWKLSISEKNYKLQLEFAKAYKGLTRYNWYKIL